MLKVTQQVRNTARTWYPLLSTPSPPLAVPGSSLTYQLIEFSQLNEMDAIISSLQKRKQTHREVKSLD